MSKIERNRHLTYLVLVNRRGISALPKDFHKLPLFKRQYKQIMTVIGVVTRSQYKGTPYHEEALKRAIINNKLCLWKGFKEIGLFHWMVQKEHDQIDKENLPKDSGEKINIEPVKPQDIRTEIEKSTAKKQTFNLFECEQTILGEQNAKARKT
jgi:hypothetical protein